MLGRLRRYGHGENAHHSEISRQERPPLRRALGQNGWRRAARRSLFIDGNPIRRTAWSYAPWMKNGAVDAGNTGLPQHGSPGLTAVGEAVSSGLDHGRHALH